MKLIKSLLLFVLVTGVCYWIINYFDLITKLDLMFELRNKKHLLRTDFWFIFLPLSWFVIIGVWLASFVGAVKYKNSETAHDVLEYAYITLIYPILDPQGENKHWLFWELFMSPILAGIVGLVSSSVSIFLFSFIIILMALGIIRTLQIIKFAAGIVLGENN